MQVDMAKVFAAAAPEPDWPALGLFDPADYRPQAEALNKLVCGCGGGAEAPLEVLRVFLDVFHWNGEIEYLDLDTCHTFEEEYGYAVYHLLFCAYQNLGFTEHYGSVDASAKLTEAGRGLKWLLAQPGFIAYAYREQ